MNDASLIENYLNMAATSAETWEVSNDCSSNWRYQEKNSRSLFY